MMYIKFVPDSTMLNVLDEPMKDDKGNSIKNSQFEFLMGRITDPAFAGELEGYDGVVLMVEVKNSLKSQKDKAEELGYWALENEPAKRLKEATMRPKNKYNPFYASNILVFLNSVKNMVDEPAKLNAVP